MVHLVWVNHPTKITIGMPKGDESLCIEKSMKEERAEIAEKDLIAGAESTVDGIRTGGRLNAKISLEIESQR